MTSNGPLELAELHLDVLYGRDEAGLLVRRTAADTVPSFHLVRTVEGNRWRLSAGLSNGQREELEELLCREPVIATLGDMETSPPARLNGGRYRGPAFVFPDPLPAVPSIAEMLGEARRARAVADLSWVRDVTPAERPVTVARNVTGEIVSVCHSARASDGAAEAGVETAPSYRGRGLAGAVVLAWAAALRDEGRLPLYSTQWTNRASRAVARTLCLIQYGEDYHD